MLQALRQNTAQYRAGVMGPDAYPDIATGQQVIHPAHNDHIANENIHKGTNDWLQHLWAKGQQSQNGAVQAFVTGYLTHAAGDMFGHTFVNNYAGGPFVIDPHTNAAKHLVFEGYVGKRTPALRKYNRTVAYSPADYVTSGSFSGPLSNRVFTPSGDFSITGVEAFIYDEMINISGNSALNSLYEGRLNVASVPFVYHTTRVQLGRHIDWYYAEKDRLRNKINACKWYDLWCMNKYNVLYAAHTTVVWGTKEYAVAWRNDIDRGLREWAKVSHELALQLIYPSADGDPQNAGINSDRRHRAQAVAENFVFNHLISMSGAPDQAGPAAQWVLGFIDRVFKSPQWLKDMKADMVDTMLKNATGKDRATWEDYITNPERKFDPVMNLAHAGGQTGALISLTSMNQTVLNLPTNSVGQADPGYSYPELRFAVDTFAPAYNTLVMSKLVLISPPEFSRFVRELPFSGPRPTTVQANAMLGFVDSLDGREDKRNARVQSGVYGDCGAYNAIFKPQIGDTSCTSAAQPVPGNPSGFVAYPDSSREVSLNWTALSGATRYTLERRTGTSTTYTVIANLDGSATWYVDTNRQPRIRYTYRLKAGNTAGLSTGVETSVTMPADEAPCRVSVPANTPASKTDEASPDYLPPC
ncbi:fibronectin type III domain-containing protein [uncultured Deinococcus sp.]|uniref:fibronectin type III domain-containing protein n=1 Tax=uncultured Deinococcus sp. TaxID=158789 RepID=UPI0025E6CE0B|nr:fibronectin type III domain-containing protein [uncultured Deinococcus sp.]